MKCNELIKKIKPKSAQYEDYSRFYVITKFRNIFADTSGTISTAVSSRLSGCSGPTVFDTAFLSNSANLIKKQLENNYKVLLLGHSYGGFIVNRLSEYDFGEKKDNLYIRTFNPIYISKSPKVSLKNIFHIYHKNDVAYNRITKYCIKSSDHIHKRIIFHGEVPQKTFWQKKNMGY